MEILLYKLSYLVTAVGGLVVFTLIVFRKTRARFNILYALTSIGMLVWAIGRYALLVVDTHEAALVWVRILYFGSIAVHLFFLHTVLVFLGVDKKRKSVLIFAYTNAIFISFLNLSDLFLGTNLFIKDVVSKLDFRFYEVPNILYNLHLFNYVFIPQYAFIEMLVALRRLRGVTRNQLVYLLISSVLGFIGGNSVVPLVYGISLRPVLVFMVPLHLFTMAYAIFKLRLMDIRAIIFRSIAFGCVVFIITGFFSIISTLVTYVFAEIAGLQSNILSGVILAVLVTVFYKPLREIVERATNTFLYKKSYDPDVLITEVNRIASSTLDLEQLLHSISKALVDAFHAEKIGVALLGRNKKLYIAYEDGFQPGVAVKLAKGNEQVMYRQFKRTPGIFVVDERKTEYENGENVDEVVSPKVMYALYQQDLALIVPLRVQDKLIGIVAIGAKKSGDPYNNQDLRVLNLISGQFAVSIENAQLYEEQKRFAIVLKEEVQKATQELRAANAELKQMDVTKSEFISIASHQLRTPLTIIKGYISMINEQAFGKVPPLIGKQLVKVYESNERLVALVEDLLNISRIESGRQEYKWESSDLFALAGSVVDNLTKSAETKGLKLVLSPSPAKMPKVICDANKLHEVMMNFVDNAIKYTLAGSVTVKFELQPAGMVTFGVTDTGMGIAKENMSYLFKKFSRVKGSFLVQPGGSGLGLYVAKRIIDVHEGKIWAESGGEGEGTTFLFSIPIAGPKVRPQPKERVVNIRTPAQLAKVAKR